MIKQIIISGILATSMFAGDNLYTIIENNSLLKIGKNDITSIDGKDRENVYEGFKNKRLKNYSPYWLNQFEEKTDITPTIITIVGERTIQDGSIYAKEFGNKYNINSMFVLLKEKQYEAILNTLDKFNNNNLIYVRTKLNEINKTDFIGFENYINNNIAEANRKRYMNRLEYIYEILEYTNTLYDIEISKLNVNVINPSYYKFTEELVNGDKLPKTGHVMYQQNGSLVTKYCDEAYKIKRNIAYRPKAISTIDFKNPIGLVDMYIFKNLTCPYVGSKNKIKYPTLPSKVEMEKSVLKGIKEGRNGGVYLSKMKTLYSSIENNTKIKSSLNKLNDRGIDSGKLIHINYGLSESINNNGGGKLVQGLLKNITTGSIYKDKINLIMNEGIVYNIDNPPSSFVDKTNTISDLSKVESKDSNIYNTLYYIVNQKLEPLMPQIDNFHIYSNLIPSNARNNEEIKALNGGEVLFLTNKDGSYISPYKYENENEILIDTEESIDEKELIGGMTNYLRNEVDINAANKSLYPINLKGIIMEYIPKNSKEDTAIKYFGPIYEQNIYVDTYNKKVIDKVNLDCTKDSCTEEEKKMTNPTREIERIETNKYCTMKFGNPDTKKYEYYVFEKEVNRIIEEPFGDVQFHANKEEYKEHTEIFKSDTKVEELVKYFGEVNSVEECREKVSNMKMLEEQKSELTSKGIINFDYNESETMSDEEYDMKSKEITGMIDEVLINKTLIVEKQRIIEASFDDVVDYEKSNQDTAYNYFDSLKSLSNVEVVDNVVIIK